MKYSKIQVFVVQLGNAIQGAIFLVYIVITINVITVLKSLVAFAYAVMDIICGVNNVPLDIMSTTISKPTRMRAINAQLVAWNAPILITVRNVMMQSEFLIKFTGVCANQAIFN